MKKILTIVGARPQFIKLAALSPVLRKYFSETIVHTGQHYDYKMSQAFFKELQIPEPDHNLEVGSDSACRQIASILVGLDDILSKERFDVVVVFGDTNSTAAGAIAAAKHQIPLAHIEAGLREFNKHVPEESNKLVTDILSDFYFAPTDTGVSILASMGIRDHVYNVGDVMIDLDFKYYDQIVGNKKLLAKHSLTSKGYFFATTHRAANTDDPDRLRQILEAFSEVGKPVVFPIHPRTRKVIGEMGWDSLLTESNIIAIDPIGYLDTQTLIAHAYAVLTDSGGVTKEAYFFKVPGIILDTQTEWVETVREGWNHITGPNKSEILETLRNLRIPTTHTNCLGDGTASEKIAQILSKNI